MLNIYLTRHGQDEDNASGILNGRRDMPLTPLGEKQAEELALKIKEAGLSFSKIYSSPLKRAYNTAKKISETLGMKDPEMLEDLIERDFGVITGKTISEGVEMCLPNVLKAEIITYALSPLKGETFPELKERGARLLERIEKENEAGNILLVSHGDIGKMIYAAYYNLDWKEVLLKFHFGNSDLLLLSKNSHPEDSHIFSAKQYNH